MSELLASFQSCCRLCLCDKTDTLVSIFGSAVDDRALPQKILAFVAIEITSSDKLSRMVCSSCISKLDSWQKFKDECGKNQDKLEQLFQSSTNAPKLHDMSVQIKEEPVDEDDNNDGVVIVNDSAVPVIKSEPIERLEEIEPEIQIEEEDFDYPPPLTPYIQHATDDDDSQISQTSQTSQNSSISETSSSRTCAVCDKSFSTPYNRRKHEKHIHGMGDLKKIPSTSASTAGSIDGGSQTSNESETNQSNCQEIMEKSTSDSEQQKIAFAAGLKLLQANETPRAFEPLSKLELSYIEKCKAMIRMHRTRVCACHSVSYNNLKGLLSHLRSIQIWFPVFTCYHCMITFTDRSTYTRHHLRSHKRNEESLQGVDAEGLVKLSNLRKRSEMKTRLYQNFKCVKCKFVYSFYDDYIKHVNEDHISNTPVTCACEIVYNDIENYKKHVYTSCLVEFYCDICSQSFPTNETFIKHAVEKHDNSEGFSLVQEDNKGKRSSTTKISPPSTTPPAPSLAINRKRRSSFYNKAPILEPELEIEELEEKKLTSFKVRNPASTWKRNPTQCLSCDKIYSSYANMMRHHKTHELDASKSGSDMEIDDSNKRFCYSCPDCGGMYDNEKWQKHLSEKHKEISCPDCDRVFHFQSELDQHRTMHLNLKVYRDSKTKSYKSTMLKSPNSVAEIIHICDRCDTTFSTIDELQKHKLLHETMPQLSPHKEIKSNKPECTDCNLTFNGYRQLWDHDHTYHPDKRTPQSKNYPKQCKYCDKLFYTGGSYFNHKQMHERIVLANTVSLNDMPKAPSKRSKQQNNEEDEEVDGESYHTCSHCFKVFASKSQLKKHNRSHVKSANASNNSVEKGKGGKKVWCDLCHVSYDNSEALEKHKLEDHHLQKEANKSPAQTNQVFTCDVCVMTFTTKLALKKHKERHAQEIRIMSKTQTVYCKFCKSAFESVPALNKHMNEDHKNELEKTKTPPASKKVPQYPCDICNKNFQSPTALYVHQGWHRRTNYGLSNKPKATKSPKSVKQKEVPEKSAFQCSTCSAELPNNTALQIHILEKHRNVDAIVLTLRCNTCKFDFKSQDEYEKHKRLHDFLEKQQNNVHLTTTIKPKTTKSTAKDASAKPKHTCPHCGSTFTRSDNLATHIRAKHNTANGQYKCTQCDRIFDKQMSLTIHLKVHEKQKLITNSKNEKSREKPKSNNTKSAAYSCSICSMGFDLPKDLRTHTINAHPF